MSRGPSNAKRTLYEAPRRGQQFGGRPPAGGPARSGDAKRAARVIALGGGQPDDVGHLHVHGLSTRTSDIEEARAVGDVFAARLTPLPVVAAKGYFGNLRRGSGMVELIASLLAIRHDRLFPVLNYTTSHPECPVAAVRDGDAKPGASFINLNVTPQGQAAAVMVRRF